MHSLSTKMNMETTSVVDLESGVYPLVALINETSHGSGKANLDSLRMLICHVTIIKEEYGNEAITSKRDSCFLMFCTFMEGEAFTFNVRLYIFQYILKSEQI